MLGPGSVETAAGELPPMNRGELDLDLNERALQVAPRLLGSLLTSMIEGERVTVRITEVEAYEGADDPASHAYRGPTARNAVMFGPPGRLYVYRHLGLHHCANVVVGPEGVASAVLIRAGEVVDGVEIAWRRRSQHGVCRSERDLARGPARLAVALGLTREQNGVAFDESGLLWLRRHAGHDHEDGPQGDPVPAVASGPRVGISGSGPDAANRPWRFWQAGSRYVSSR